MVLVGANRSSSGCSAVVCTDTDQIRVLRTVVCFLPKQWAFVYFAIMKL